MQTLAFQEQQHIGEFILRDLREAENERVQDKELADEKWGKYLLIFQGVIYLLAIISYGYGDPTYLGIPYDSENYACGVDLGLEQYSIIYFTNPTDAKYNWKTLCVSKCPKAASPEAESDESLEIDCYPNSIITSCQNRPSLDDPDYSLHYYDTVQFNTACLPTKTSYLQTILPALSQPTIVSMLSDIDHGKWIIISMLCLCMILNLTLYNWLQKIPTITIWILAVCSSFFLLLSGMLGFLYSMNINDMQNIPKKDTLTQEECVGIVQAQTVQTGFIIILSLVFLTLGLAIIIWSIFDRNKIKTIGKKVSIINYYIDMTPDSSGNERFKEIILLILGISISLVIFSMLWMRLSLYLFSMGSADGAEHELPYSQYAISWVAYILGIIHVIELIVIAITLIQSGIFIIMAKIVEIYRYTIQQHGFYISDEQKKDRGIMEIIQMYLKFNIGTVIIGEILIFLSGIPRYCLEFYYWFRIKIKMPSEINERNLKILSINDRAYLFAFLKNDNFLESCKHQQQVDNDLKKSNKLYDHGYTFKIMYCSAISNFCISITYLIIMLSTKTISLNNPLALIMIILLFTYMISSVFASVYGQSIEYLNIVLHRDMKQQENPGEFMNRIVQALSKQEI